MPHTDKKDHVCHLQKSLQHLAQQVEIKPYLKNVGAKLKSSQSKRFRTTHLDTLPSSKFYPTTFEQKPFNIIPHLAKLSSNGMLCFVRRKTETPGRNTSSLYQNQKCFPNQLKIKFHILCFWIRAPFHEANIQLTIKGLLYSVLRCLGSSNKLL